MMNDKFRAIARFTSIALKENRESASNTIIVSELARTMRERESEESELPKNLT